MLAGLHQRESSRFYGKYPGIVTALGENDQGVPCCIKAKVPGIYHDDEESPWALPCVPFAGDSEGLVYLPKIGAHVWIEFQAGDISQPIWVGGWWPRGQRPAPEGNTIRLVSTKAGHKIILDEEGDEITLKHPGGAEIKLSAGAISLSVGINEIVIDGNGIKINGTPEVSINRGIGKFTTAGASLVFDAFKIGG
jgi:hypothetical protein